MVVDLLTVLDFPLVEDTLTALVLLTALDLHQALVIMATSLGGLLVVECLLTVADLPVDHLPLLLKLRIATIETETSLLDS